MPDEPQTNNQTQSAQLPDNSGAPVTADPQQLVDAALSSPSQSTQPTMQPTIEETPVETPHIASVTPEPTVPPELLSPQPSETPVPPVSSPTSVPMTDEMPLAFANSMPADMPKIETTPEPAPQPEEKPLPAFMAPPPSDIPPAPPAGMTPPVPPKKKLKMGKMMAAIVGFFLLIGGVGAGYLYYNSWLYPQDAEILAVTSKEQCKGCSPDGFAWKWHSNDQKCVKSAQSCTGGGGGTVPEIGACDAAHPFPCGKTPDGKCGGFCITGRTMTCDQALKEKCGFEPQRGATFKIVPVGAQCPAGYQSAQCTCGLTAGQKMCFDRGLPDQCGTPDDKNGLCAVWQQAGSPKTPSQQEGGVAKTYYCPGQFLSENSNACMTEAPANFNMNCFCGTIQVDTPGVGFTSKSMKCGCDEDKPSPKPSPSPSPKPSPSPSPKPSPSPSPKPSPSPSPSPTPKPTLACTGLTKNVANADIKVGTKIDFTCAGSSSPAGKVNLSYQFRLRKDSGAWQTLSATGNKASYTVAAVGDYNVQCRACGTIDNANVCDPTWQGTTQ